MGLALSNRTTLQGVLTADYDAIFRRLKRQLGLFQIGGDVEAERWRPEGQYLSAAEVAALLDVSDASLETTRASDRGSTKEGLARALGELSRRRRKVFRGAMLQKMPDHEIAALLGLATRTVESDLRHALRHCASRLGRRAARRSDGAHS
jgi:RNA polymerase sigma-70 factor (ECF subfamily)